MKTMGKENRELIITIVNRGCGDTVLEASMKTGAEEENTIMFRTELAFMKEKITGDSDRA